MISKWLQIFSGKKLSLIGSAALSIFISISFTVVDPLAMKVLVDDGLLAGNGDVVFLMVGIIFIFGVALRLLHYYKNIFIQRMANAKVTELTKHMLSAYYRIPYEKTMRHGKGYFIQRVYEEPRAAVQEGILLILGFAEGLVVVISALIISLYFSWRASLVLLVLIPFIYYITRCYGSKITRQTAEESELKAKFTGSIGQSFEAYKTVNSFQLQSQALASVAMPLYYYLKSLLLRIKSAERYQAISSSFLSLSESAVLFVAAIEVTRGNMTVGSLLGFVSVFSKVVQAIVGILQMTPQLSKINAIINRIHEFNSQAVGSSKEHHPLIHVEDFKFTYDHDKTIPYPDFRILPGERRLILGPNGSGKSTLAHCLAGYLEGEGRVQLPNQTQISAMLDPLAFFQGTLRDHLTRLCSPEKTEWLERILLDFGLKDKVDKDPSHFSAGEKRKAFTLLTLMKDASVYIFDEPLGRVDIESKRTIMNWILKITQGKTLIVIMHGDEDFHHFFDHVLRLENTIEKKPELSKVV